MKKKTIYCEGCHSCMEPCGRTTKEVEGMEVILLLAIALGVIGVMIAGLYLGLGLIGFLILIACCGYVLEEFAKPLLYKIVNSEEE